MWKVIKNYPKYEVNELGVVRIIKTQRVLTQYKNNCGYYRVMLISPMNKKHNEYVHRLVAEAFIPNPLNNKYVNHKDEDKSNNTYLNLEWCTSSYNRNYGSLSDKLRYKFSIPIVSEHNGIKEIYKSFTYVAKYNNVSQSYISQLFRRSNRIALNKNWRYATPKEIEILNNKDLIILNIAE